MAEPGPAFAQCEAALRDQDRDRWLACLLVPEAQRPFVTALHAFAAEIGGVRDHVTSPLPGEVRLQWWRDWLESEARGDAASVPLAAALGETIERCSLPRQTFLAMIDAHVQDLYDDPVATLGDLEGYCGETESALLRLATLVLAAGGEAGAGEAPGHAGVAIGITRLLRRFARDAARGQCFVPQDMLAAQGADRADILAGRATPAVKAVLAAMRAEARRHLAATRSALGGLPKAVKPALLPMALAGPYLKVMDRAGYEPFRDPVEVPQWRRQWALWRSGLA